jgi:chorismate mutase / prephenate dehydrogenase
LSEVEIARLREEIAEVDREIIGLVERRLDLAGQVGLEKKILARPLRDPRAEEVVQARLVAEAAKRGISPSFGEGLARLLIEESLRRQEKVRPSVSPHQRVLVVGGAGRMGQWLCRYFRSHGWDVVVNDIAGPLDGFPFEPDLAKGVREADVIAVSVPMSASAEVLRSIALLKPKALLFDVCSLKAPVERELRAMSRSGLRIASVHPLFGPTFWPLSSGSITFSDCGNSKAVLEARERFRASGASLVGISLDHHDESMAYLLGLSQLCLLTFARCVAESPFDLAGLKGPAGTTFSRLSTAAARLLADPPTLLRDIQALNPHTPVIHRRIRETLDEWQSATASGAADFLRLLGQTRSDFAGKVSP